MNENTEQIVKPFATLKKEVRKIAEGLGFNTLDFGVDPCDEDGRPHVRVVFEWDPEKENKPEIIIVQATAAMNEEAERAAQERLAKDVEAARKALEADAELEKRMKRKGGGFLD